MQKLSNGAKIAVKICMGVKPRERVLVVTDPARLRVAEALVKAAQDAEAEAVLMCMRARTRHGEEPPKPVERAMVASDVVLAPTTYSLTHTQARLRACRAGTRVATMPMITERMMCRGAMLADYDEVSRLTRKVAALLTKSSEVEVNTPAGTDLYLDITGRKAHADTGIFHRPGDFGNLPAGEAFIAPLEGKGEGRIVVDGSMVDTLWARTEIAVKKGRATEISGEPARRLKKMLEKVGPRAYNLAEFGIGTNPTARLIGNVLEDEKVLGTCHIAFGDNSTFGGRIRAGIHVDGILMKPTIKFDGNTVVKEGRLKV
ncbi:MAG: aminopeptidase [Candidatus Hodarchaeaceae archaeon]|nr:aminopeptidase [Candidatus Hodarchaeaceae archaeon]